jgi:hypothetical protein
MSLWRAWLPLIALSFSTIASSQQKVDPHFTHHRVFCIVPLVGSGTSADPRRPDYVPIPLAEGASGRGQTTGIVAFSYEVSNDGNWALAEIVALDRASLLPILSDTRPGVWAGEKGVVSRAAVQAAFDKLKSGINLDKFGVAVQ